MYARCCSTTVDYCVNHNLYYDLHFIQIKCFVYVITDNQVPTTPSSKIRNKTSIRDYTFHIYITTVV